MAETNERRCSNYKTLTYEGQDEKTFESSVCSCEARSRRASQRFWENHIISNTLVLESDDEKTLEGVKGHKVNKPENILRHQTKVQKCLKFHKKIHSTLDILKCKYCVFQHNLGICSSWNSPQLSNPNEICKRAENKKRTIKKPLLYLNSFTAGVLRKHNGSCNSRIIFRCICCYVTTFQSYVEVHGRISKRVFQENKARQIFRKTKNFLPSDNFTTDNKLRKPVSQVHGDDLQFEYTHRHFRSAAADQEKHSKINSNGNTILL